MDIAGSTLPALKTLLDGCYGSAKHVGVGSGATPERIVHGLLGACIGNVDDMR
jgi:hypothetical protein